MPSPFPGMDPYLESPTIWPDVHHRLISEIQSTLNPRLRPQYVARVELRVYFSLQLPVQVAIEKVTEAGSSRADAEMIAVADQAGNFPR